MSEIIRTFQHENVQVDVVCFQMFEEQSQASVFKDAGEHLFQLKC